MKPEKDKHTPGKWKFKEMESGFSTIYAEDSKAAIGIIYSKEDAKLSVRAPELLEENRRLREAIKKSINNYYGNYGGHIDILKQALEGTE